MMHFHIAPELNVAPVATQQTNIPNPRTVLEELFVLLEDYGPVWYTQELHDRAINALLEREG